MRYRLIPRDEGFYDLFDDAASNLLDTARLLRGLLDELGDGSVLLKRIKEHEQRGDKLTGTILRRLHSSFVTPFDREDIHVLTEELDDAVDDIHGAADTLVLHNVRADQIPDEVREMVDLLIEAAEETVDLIQLLPTLKGMGSPTWSASTSSRARPTPSTADAWPACSPASSRPSPS